MSRRNILRFGIPTLDSLLGTTAATLGGKNRGKRGGSPRPIERDQLGFNCPAEASASVCLIGSHGTGKSVLALHFASRYFADFLDSDQPSARVFYVSTDLSYPMAEDLWANFALNRPNLRWVPFDEPYGTEESRARDRQLRRVVPLETDAL